MMYWPLEAVIRHTRGHARRTLQEIVDNHQIVSSQYGHRIFACPRCDTLHQRFYVRVDYDESKQYHTQCYETMFRCGKCRTPLTERDKPIHGYRCAECGSYALKDEVRINWD